MSTFQIPAPVPETPRFIAVCAIIEKEAKPLLDLLGDELVAQIRTLARTPGKNANGQKLRTGLFDELKASLDIEIQGTAKMVYGMFRRASRGQFERFGHLYLVDEAGNEISAHEFIAHTGQIDTRSVSIADALALKEKNLRGK